MSTDKQMHHRLNRVQGQIEAIRKRLDKHDSHDCVETLRLIKAANNALKKFGEAYVQAHIDVCIQQGKSPKEMEAGLKEVVTSAFYL